MSWFHRFLSHTASGLRPRASNPVRFESLRKSGCLSTLTSTGIFLTMSAIEKIFSAAEFDCPCNLDAVVHDTLDTEVDHVDHGHFIWTYRFVYGLACIFVPAVALFFLAIVLNPTTWILSTGFCHLRLGCHWRSQLLLWRAMGKAAVVAMAWVFFALLNGEYVKCAMTVESCGTGKSAKDVTTLNPAVWVAMSRLLALLVGLLAVIISCCGNFVIRCCFKRNSYHQECLKAKYKEHKIQKLEELERLSYEKLADLQLARHDFAAKSPSASSSPTEDVDIEASIDGEAHVEKLQHDLRAITRMIEDYNFSQNMLDRELGLSSPKAKKKGKKEADKADSVADKTDDDDDRIDPRYIYARQLTTTTQNTMTEPLVTDPMIEKKEGKVGHIDL